jgi:hypothetical protein
MTRANPYCHDEGCEAEDLKGFRQVIVVNRTFNDVINLENKAPSKTFEILLAETLSVERR